MYKEIPVTKNDRALKKMPIGVIASADNPEEDLRIVKDMGFSVCQLNISEYSSELAKRLSDTLSKYQIHPSTLICTGPGEHKYNFIDGPSSIGLVPCRNREARVERLRQGIDFCKTVGIPAVHAHFGFIPEDPKNILYIEFIETMRKLGEYGLLQGIDFYFESGQETPITLLRAIEDIGTGNMFVNYDTANLAMYGKANPFDGLKVLSKYVKAFHAKDGMYPTIPYELGKEVPIPEGVVDFPKVFEYLKEIDFTGEIIIECEMSGQQKDYILTTKKYLEGLILS
ncbi:MAG: sugar phosphate isomerase/epimerase [Bacteroidetes bacterium]|nr:MAG: sugar phosphate isomerase/epimerase [Bacteroidota bacterium]